MRLQLALGAKFARPWRLDPGRRAAIAVALGVLVAAVATGAWVVAERPRAVAVPTNSSPAAARTAPSTVAGATRSAAADPRQSPRPSAASTTASAGSEVVVDVAGKVRRPGLYRLPSGARVDDAVRAAGGALTGVNLTSLNLAAKVVDGQQIRVGLPGEAPPNPVPGAAPAGTAGTTSTSPVDLNTASSDQLQTLPGVGPVLAQHILDWRAAHGSFDTVDQLNDVPGIGEVKFASLRSRVTV
ncbi:MAG TPA: helix-hairpin-helix domain-containing protein [Jatrophihabitans sp.]|nr:helix-hairpin-helix domain-containing protein [Jatrophihabitans sp.]